jgi:acyl-CoA synthetase (AMP-forming)/AMP-acid ligase II
MGSRVNLYPVDTIHGAFVAAANAHPDRIAVLGNDDDGTPNLSFRQLVNLCRSFAQHLTRTSSSTHARCGPAIFRTGDPSPGIAVGASVAVSLDSSIELIVAYFAVLMAGKAFAPLETTLPPAALTGVLSALHEHANLTHHIVSVTGGDTGGKDHPIRPGTRTLAIRLSKTKSHPGDDAEPRLEVHESGVPVTVIRCADTLDVYSDLSMEEDEMVNTTRGGPDDVAHVIHTGGSTGAPKAVVCAHRGSLASHAARAATHPYVADDVTGVCVFGVWDAVCALLAGSKVAMLPPESITDGGDVLGRYLCDNEVTRTMLTPSLAELLVAAAAHAESVHAREALDAMRVLVLCGETPRVGLVDALLSSQRDETNQKDSKSRVVANLYSVSEAHDVALERNLGSAVQEGLTSTCGVPYGHVHLAIADDDGCVLTESESEGWLHIAGDGVASGYLGPHGWEATRRAFVPRTWLDGVTRTWYATGDRAKVRKDGRLVLLGRGAGAGRVKIRGKLVRLFWNSFYFRVGDLTDDVFNTCRLTSTEWRRFFGVTPG